MEQWQHLEPGTLTPNPYDSPDEVWLNDIYQVNVYKHQKSNSGVLMTWLSIKRRDKEPCRDWRHFQWIKNQLVGPENEAVELYPAESRLLDSSNQYHLWVIEDPKIRFPWGFPDRGVVDVPFPGAKQRPFPENMRPKDVDKFNAQINAEIEKRNKNKK